MNNEKMLGFGAHSSPVTGNELQGHIDFPTTGTPPPQSFEIVNGFPHYNQNSIGICTAICLAQMMEKAWGIPFSPQFIYNVGKKLFDGNTLEGSSILSMLRVLNKYGAAPKSLVPTDDTTKPYDQYVNQWFGPEVFAEALKYKMNYATARLDPVGFASDLSNSNYGLATRMAVGSEFFTDINGKSCYSKECLDPLRHPSPVTGGHATTVLAYKGLDDSQYRTIHNTWGDSLNPLHYAPPFNVWGDNGDIHYYYKSLKDTVTEAWSISKPLPDLPLGYTFTKTLVYGSINNDVLHLQMYLNNHGFPVALSGVGSSGHETNYCGTLTLTAVKKWQVSNGINDFANETDMEKIVFGPKSRAVVNVQP